MWARINQKFLPEITTSTPIQGSFTCRKSMTWDPQLYFPSEGRRAEDLFRPEKSWRLRPGLNPQTWVLKGSTPHLDHQSRWFPVRFPLTGCQATSRPCHRFSRYSKWINTFWTALVYGICFIFLTEYNHTPVVPPGHAMPQPPPAPYPAASRIPAQPEITVAYGLPPTQVPAYLVHGKVGGKSGISYTGTMFWKIQWYLG